MATAREPLFLQEEMFLKMILTVENMMDYHKEYVSLTSPNEAKLKYQSVIHHFDSCWIASVAVWIGLLSSV